MKKVSICIKKLTEIFDNLTKKEDDELEHMVKELSKLEHEADLTKNDIRKHLPKGLFLPIDRSQFLDILAIQDQISDQAEDIGNLLILYPKSKFGDLCTHLQMLFHENIQAFWSARDIIKALHELLESSFGGAKAEKVKITIEQTSRQEYEADKTKHELMREFFTHHEKVTTPVFYLYIRLIEEINQISHISENLANKILMILELK